MKSDMSGEPLRSFVLSSGLPEDPERKALMLDLGKSFVRTPCQGTRTLEDLEIAALTGESGSFAVRTPYQGTERFYGQEAADSARTFSENYEILMADREHRGLIEQSLGQLRF